MHTSSSWKMKYVIGLLISLIETTQHLMDRMKVEILLKRAEAEKQGGRRK